MNGTLRHTRESWLEAAIDVFRDQFKDAGYPIPKKVHVSVGFSYGARSESKKIMGVTYSRHMSKDGVPHVFVSPELGDTFDVLETLLHELVHVADDCESGHRGRFVDIAKSVGLTRPWTYTPSTPAVQAELLVLAAELGEYPHGVLTPRRVSLPTTAGGVTTVDSSLVPIKFTSGPDKQKTYMKKYGCVHCGFSMRTTNKQVLEFGQATHCGTEMEER